MRMKRTHRRSTKRSKNRFVARVARDYPWRVLAALKAAVGTSIDPALNSRLEQCIVQRDIASYMALGDDFGLQCIPEVVKSGPRFDIEAQLLLVSVIKKFQFPGDRDERRARALEAFSKAEQSCQNFNRYGRRVLTDSDEVLREAKGWIERVIGRHLPCWEELTEHARHGPGASIGSSRDGLDSYSKYANLPYTVTRSCLQHGERLIKTDARWCRALTSKCQREKLPIPLELSHDNFRIVEGNRITTVEKDALKDRPIAIEPTINVMLQLGVDGFIRKRLKRWDINLDSQLKNQRLAYIGSLDCSGLSPATIDLAAASDTISLGIAKWFLPPEWWKYVCDLRSPIGVLPDGRKVRYSKLSSMGNGYTFAVESLIFGALAYACCIKVLGYYPRDRVAVFGDDLIVPEVVAPVLVRYLSVCGFSINQEKSFLAGSVKESCGTDWVRGMPVRPVFLKEAPRYIDEVYQDRNRLYRWFCQHGREYQFAELDRLFHRWLPEWARAIRGPCDDEEFGGWIHDPSLPLRRQPNGSFGRLRVVHCWLKDRKVPADDFLLLTAKLKSAPHVDVWRDKLTNRSIQLDSVPDGDRKYRMLTRRRFWLAPDSYSSPVELLRLQ